MFAFYQNLFMNLVKPSEILLKKIILGYLLKKMLNLEELKENLTSY